MKIKLLFLFCFICANLFAQDLNQIGKAKLFSYAGGINANTIFYDGTSNRDPFTYVLSGNINFNISGVYNIPLSFTYSNQKFSNNQPFKFNRLSIHPSYKWVTAHIGDVSMTFSPYTLSGHQFTGLGIDLTPEGPFKISAMYGRLIRPIEYNINVPETEPAYKRIGYGLKTSYDFDIARVGLTFFSAKDTESSLIQPIPVEIDIKPKQNLVVSLDGSIKFLEKGIFNFEYAVSALTEDLIAGSTTEKMGILSFLYNERLSTSYYKAFNANVNYGIGNGSAGVGYERIDPNYRTLGAYYFNNDLENITVNASQTIFNDKLSLSINAGLQRDNLNNTKSSDMKRIVTSVNANLRATEKLNINTSYSNFQSYTNIRSQFDYINAISDYDNLDSLNFKQLSQNASLGISYTLSKSKQKQQNINLNLSFQDTKDLQEQAFANNENTISSSQFYNSAASFTLSFPETTLSMSTALNATFNKTQDFNSTTIGPTLVIGKQLFDKKLRTSFSSSYNSSYNDGTKQSNILNFRVNAGYQLFESHQFSLSALSLFRDSETNNNNDFTITFSYNYNFSSSKREKEKQRKKIPAANDNVTLIKFRHNGKIYEGNANEVISEIEKLVDLNIINHMPENVKNEIDSLRNEIISLKTGDPEALKEKALDYIESIQKIADFDNKLEIILAQTIQQLIADANKLDYQIEAKFVRAKSEIDNHLFEGQPLSEIQDTSNPLFNEYKKLYEQFLEAKKVLVSHRWMLSELNKFNGKSQNNIESLKTFKYNNIGKYYQKSIDNQGVIAINDYIVIDLIKHYYKLADDNVDDEKYTLKYTQTIKN